MFFFFCKISYAWKRLEFKMLIAHFEQAGQIKKTDLYGSHSQCFVNVLIYFELVNVGHSTLLYGNHLSISQSWYRIR